MIDDSPAAIASELLPEGFRDRLPPSAARLGAVSSAMLDVMAGYGYERVAPPLAEFETTLAQRIGKAARGDLLRVTDPATGQTLAIRNDITVQIGRMASGRLRNMPRPLRLSYEGQIMRLRASQLRPERELAQLGAELIGSDSVAAAGEIVMIAVEALEAAGVQDITVDMTLPDLVETLSGGAFPIDAADLNAVRAELDMKDAGALQAMDANAYLPLLEATGPFDDAVQKLRDIDAGGQLASRIAALEEIAGRIKDRVTVTLDPTERHGFEYQSWFGFTLYAGGHAAALGRGGSYGIGGSSNSGDGQNADEPAVGFSIYPGMLQTGPDAKEESRRLFVPAGADASVADKLRSEGWITVHAICETDDGRALNCSHILNGAAPETL